MQTKPYVLLVDDDSTAQFLTRRALSKIPFEGDFIEAYDGIDACACIKEHGTPLLVLLDLRMPRMDGHELLQIFSHGELGKPPQVCIVSSSNRPEDKQLEDDFAFVRTCFEKPITKAQIPHIASLFAEFTNQPPPL